MKHSKIALRVLAAKESGRIKSNTHFWTDFSEKSKFEEHLHDDLLLETVDRISEKFFDCDDNDGVICAFDDDFPVINRNIVSKGDKPFLLFYRGNLNLMKSLNSNVAVIGLTDPDEDIIRRESDVVNKLVKNDLVIVSGLANGCDAVAHKTCLDSCGKTIAILPSPINKIYPASNRPLAEEIVEHNGLLISEYYTEPVTKFEAVNRFIERDRLQAMFAKAVIMIASYSKGKGDSGSRHAMEAARKYNIERFVMYNRNTDEDNPRFGLNKEYVVNSDCGNVTVLQNISIDYLTKLRNQDLEQRNDSNSGEQLSFL